MMTAGLWRLGKTAATKNTRFCYVIPIVASILVWVNSAGADVTVFTNKPQWQSTVGAYTTLTFVEYPVFTIITNQYHDQGIDFTDGNDHVITSSSYSDNHGLRSFDGFGNLGTIHMSFSQPRYSLGFDFIGGLRIELYSQGEPIFTSGPYNAGFTPFVGLVSTIPFDSAVVWDYADAVVAIDNIHFGPPVPPISGACCLDNGTCQNGMIQVECLYQGGLYQGDDSSCGNLKCPVPCPADVTNDQMVGIDDLLAVINGWGGCPSSPTPCPPDIDHNHFVNIDDLLAVITAWGPCPQ